MVFTFSAVLTRPSILSCLWRTSGLKTSGKTSVRRTSVGSRMSVGGRTSGSGRMSVGRRTSGGRASGVRALLDAAL